MTTVGKFGMLEAEHEALRPRVESIRLAAEAIDLPSARDAFEFVDDVWRFVTGRLVAHAKAEEEVLYPAMTAVLGSSEAARLMVLDHEDILRFAEELGELRSLLADHDRIDHALAIRLRQVLYGLYALVIGHFEKEEQVLIPTLEELGDREAEHLMHRMHQHEGHHAGAV